MNAPVNVPTRDEVSPVNQAAFDRLQKQLGFVPNLYATFAPSAHALPTYLALQAARSSLSAREREVINLAVSEVNGCEYCRAAHTVIAPCLIESFAFGTTSSGSISGREPRPLHSWQKPSGELNENASGTSSGKESPHATHAAFSL